MPWISTSIGGFGDPTCIAGFGRANAMAPKLTSARAMKLHSFRVTRTATGKVGGATPWDGPGEYGLYGRGFCGFHI